MMKRIVAYVLALAALCSCGLEEPRGGEGRVTLTLGCAAEAVAETRALGQSDDLDMLDAFRSCEEVDVDRRWYGIYLDGTCIWAGSGPQAVVDCPLGASLKVVAFANYYDMRPDVGPGSDYASIASTPVDFEQVFRSIDANDYIPMYGETDIVLSGDASVSVTVRSIISKVEFGSAMPIVDGDLYGMGFDEYATHREGTGFLAPLVYDHPLRLTVHGCPRYVMADGSAWTGTETLDPYTVCPALQDEDGNSVGTYFPPTAGGSPVNIVIETEFQDRTWHWAIPMETSEGEDAVSNTEYWIDYVFINHFCDWDETWSVTNVGISVSPWNPSITYEEII